MIDINYKGIGWGLAIAAMMILMLMIMVASSGCVSMAKEVYRGATATPEPTPTPSPIPTTPPTPTPTPVITVPTLWAHYVDPYSTGERWEGQWFKWLRLNVQGINGEGLKDLNVGIIEYRHRWLDSYTWYNDAMGQYYVQEPPAGKRFFVVWVHEEMLGNTSENDPSMWIFDETAFHLQYNGQLHDIEKSHNPVNRIKEFDFKYDYYNTVTAGPFGWDIKYIGMGAKETGGLIAERKGWLRMGPGNAVDGYLIYEVPENVKESDLLLVGSFSTFGNAYWRFTT